MKAENFQILKKEIVNYCIVDRKYNTILGEYSTEERAKEVLQEIVNAIECWEDLKVGMPHGTPSFKYELPKE